MHKWFAKELLLRKNPYRGNLTFVEDPAVAMIELSNENSLFKSSSESTLSALPEYYDNEFNANYTTWLKAKYGTTENLRAAWAPTHPEECNAGLTSRVCEKKEGAKDLITTKLAKWRLEKNTGNATVTDNKDGSVTIDVLNTSDTNWHLMLAHKNIELNETKSYIVEFYAKSLGEDRPLSYGISMAVNPWSQLAS